MTSVTYFCYIFVYSALTTLYFESPFITDDAVDILKEICCNHTFGLFILNELVTKRPPRQLVYLNALLIYTSHKNSQVIIYILT